MNRLCYYNPKPEKLYQYLGKATPAGVCKGQEPLAIYRDNQSGELFFRTLKDFSERMSLLVAET